jgi:UDP-2,3-diacylglucosamine pyrophosphatase LpxH
METIIHDHPVWFDALGKFLRDGNRAIFIIGNHDIELHWPAVQSAISERLKAAGGDPGAVRFAEWFYISNKDTFIEHGNQYDPYSLCDNPLNPAIHERHGDLLKLPFGNLAGKFMLNGMGLMNPHVEGSYIKDSLFEYLHFTYKYVVKTQPLIVWDWFWSATATWVVTLREGFARPLSDPLTFADRVGKVAERANASPQLVLALRELHAHPAYFSPLQLLRELWLDRVIAVVLVVALSFTFFSYLNVFIDVSYWWFLVPLALLIPIPLLYARTVTSEVEKAQAAAMATAPTAVKLANLYAPVRISRVVYGHTHREMKKMLDTETGADTPVEYLNTGTWSPAFHDVECTQRYGRSCFAWIKPGAPGGRRVASLYEWKNGAALEIVAN